VLSEVLSEMLKPEKARKKRTSKDAPWLWPLKVVFGYYL
jgi:hypothetical protein